MSVLKMELTESSIAQARSEQRQAALERENASLKLELAASRAQSRSTMEEAARLLSAFNDTDDGSYSSSAVTATASQPSSSPRSSYGQPPSTSMASSAATGSSSGDGSGRSNANVFNLFGFNPMSKTNGKPAEPPAVPVPGSRSSSPISSNGAMSSVATAAAVAAAASRPAAPSQSRGSTVSPVHASGSTCT